MTTSALIVSAVFPACCCSARNSSYSCRQSTRTARTSQRDLDPRRRCTFFSLVPQCADRTGLILGWRRRQTERKSPAPAVVVVDRCSLSEQDRVDFGGLSDPASRRIVKRVEPLSFHERDLDVSRLWEVLSRTLLTCEAKMGIVLRLCSIGSP